MSDAHTNNAARPTKFAANMNNLASVVFLLAIAIMANYLGYRYYWHKDVSPGRFYELSEKTRAILKGLKEPVKVIAYYSSGDSADDHTVPERARTETDLLLRQYRAVNRDKFEIEHVDPAIQSQRAEELIKKYKMNKMDNLLLVEYKDRHQKIPLASIAEFEQPDFMNPNKAQRMKEFRGEALLTGAISNVLEGKASKVYYVVGHGERNSDDVVSLNGAGKLASAIHNENVQMEMLNLSQSPAVPADAQAVLIVGPQTAFTAAEINALDNYLETKNGKLLIFIDPNVNTGLENLALRYGMRIENDEAMLRGVSMEQGGKIVNTPYAVVESYPTHPVTRLLQGYNLILYAARSVNPVEETERIKALKVMPLLITNASYWSAMGYTKSEGAFDPAKTPLHPMILGSLYDGGNVSGEAVNVDATRLMIIGSSAFLSNQYLSETGADFALNSLDWMIKKNATLGISPKTPREYRMVLTDQQTFVTSLMACVVLPSMALAWGGMVWFSRRR